MSNESKESAFVHPFERAGFGTAPYRVTGYGLSKFQACQGAPVQCGTSCDLCATGIMHVYVITSSEGVTFKVGSDCVLKTKDTGLRAGMRSARREFVNRDHLARVRADRAEREAKKEAARRLAAVEYAFGLELLFTLVATSKSDWASRLFMRMGRELADGEIPTLDGWKRDERDPDVEGPAFWEAVTALSVVSSTHIGEVGKRLRGVRCTLLRVIRIESFSQYAAFSYINVFRADSGAVLCWKTSTGRACEVGSVVELTGTVKAHTEYNGTKQTELARCKVAA